MLLGELSISPCGVHKIWHGFVLKKSASYLWVEWEPLDLQKVLLYYHMEMWILGFIWHFFFQYGSINDKSTLFFCIKMGKETMDHWIKEWWPIDPINSLWCMCQ